MPAGRHFVAGRQATFFPEGGFPMDLTTSRCWAEINLGALRRNCRTLHGLLSPGCRLMNILKANAYGHGAVAVARVLAEEFPEDWIGVACLSEALELRQAGIRQNILILGYTPPQAAAILSQENITQSLLSPGYTRQLIACAQEAGVRVPCHLKLDTGMTRIGYTAYGEAYAQTVRDAALAYQAPELNVSGIFTHFSSAYGLEPEDISYTKTQFERFARVCRTLAAQGISPGLRHCCNSPATVNSPQYALDMCRTGTVLYGLLPETSMRHPIPFEPVLTWKSRVVQLRSIPSGIPISYNRLAISDAPMTLAVISAGDADGYPRQLTNLGRVNIAGHICPVVGRVCMDMFMADVTGCNDIQEGTAVTLLGGTGSQAVPCSWLYRPLNLGPSAITSNIRARVPYLYLDND